MFQHKLIEAVELDTEYVDGKRFYKTPSGNNYPSVTSVLSSIPNRKLQEWRQRVGEQEAAKISTQASRRGTAVHSVLEKFLYNDSSYNQNILPTTSFLCKQITDYLTSHCDVVYGVEIPLYSDIFKIAGKCDMVGRIHGMSTVGDFKTSSKIKQEQWIENYFLQCTFYAMMLYERHSLWCPQICVMIATEEGTLQPFVKRTRVYMEKAVDIVRNYHASKAESSIQ